MIWSELGDAATRVGGIMIFLAAITVVAEIASAAGVFDVAARWAARAGRGRTWVLWLLVVLLSCAVTIVLGLDTTAVLLTPVVLAVATQVGVPAMPFALTTVWLANTASLLLPVSNLTNLLALHQFSDLGLDLGDYVRHAWAPALAAIVATVVVIAALFWRSLSGRYRAAEPATPDDPILLRGAAAVCLLLVPAFLTGVEPAIPAVIAAAALMALLAWRDRARVREIEIPWRMVLITGAVLIVIILAVQHGLDQLAADLLGEDPPPWRAALSGALGANLVNNLPAYLALEPAASGDPVTLMALLIGVNVGPIVTLWGSLATLLWRDRCRRAGLEVSIGPFMLRSALAALVAVGAAVAVLTWTT
ncbi:SLC13 family permease [Dermacoccaceae bacterium W4C1]